MGIIITHTKAERKCRRIESGLCVIIGVQRGVDALENAPEGAGRLVVWSQLVGNINKGNVNGGAFGHNFRAQPSVDLAQAAPHSHAVDGMSEPPFRHHHEDTDEIHPGSLDGVGRHPYGTPGISHHALRARTLLPVHIRGACLSVKQAPYGTGGAKTFAAV